MYLSSSRNINSWKAGTSLIPLCTPGNKRVGWKETNIFILILQIVVNLLFNSHNKSQGKNYYVCFKDEVDEEEESKTTVRKGNSTPNHLKIKGIWSWKKKILATNINQRSPPLFYLTRSTTSNSWAHCQCIANAQ